MKLVVLKVCSADGFEYGAITFDQCSLSYEEAYCRMVEDSSDAIEDLDDGWRVEMAAVINVRSKAEAEKLVEGMVLVSEILGDYDSQKHINWSFVFDDGKEVYQW